jgi:uncharacterized membrane protein
VTMGWMQSLRSWPARRWLFLMMAGYFVAAVAGTWIDYVTLHLGTTGIYDLSINQQALSSTIHGNFPYAFYEASNCGRNDRCSFLLVHPVLIDYVLTIPYALAPSALTLFAIQDFALALAAFPLFLIARIETRSDRLSLLTAGAYLVWLPAFSGIFSFHWEAFLPVEIFTVFWCWLTSRYVLAIPVIVFAYFTLEIVSVLLFCVAIYFLLPWFRVFGSYLSARLRLMRMQAGPARDALAAALRRVRGRLFTSPRARASIALALASGLAYIGLHELIARGGGLLGLPPLPPQYVLPLTQPIYAATISLPSLLLNWPAKLIFWIVILALLGFVPLLAPKEMLVLVAPWAVFSLLVTDAYYRMGFQYAFITASVLFLAFVYGLVRVQRWANGPHPYWAHLRSRVSSSPAVSSPSGSGADGTRIGGASASRVVPRSFGRSRRRAWTVVGTVFAVVVAFNLLANPLNPLSPPLRTQEPFATQAGFQLDGWPSLTDYMEVEKLISIIGPRSSLAVSQPLMSLVSSDPYAYELVTRLNYTWLPFVSEQPEFVMLTQKGTVMPSFLATTLYDPSIYGVRAWIPTTYLGGVILFERGYNGTVQTIGGDPPLFGGATYTAGSGLGTGPAGTVFQDPVASASSIVAGKAKPAGSDHFASGLVFTTAALQLMAGNYSIQITMRGTESFGASGVDNNTTSPQNDSSYAMRIQIQGSGANIETAYLSLSWFAAQTWESLSLNVSLPAPVISFKVIGVNQHSWFDLEAASVVVTPDP